MPDVKLIALDAEDLGVLSAHLQDAIVRVGDMAFLPRERRFAMLCNRFDPLAAQDEPGTGRRRRFTRRRSGLRLERVLAAQVSGIDLRDARRYLVLLSATYEPVAGQEPEGHVLLTFAGSAGVRLHVECVEAELKDLGAAWHTKRQPQHDDQ
jgi:hypothetical protein